MFMDWAHFHYGCFFYYNSCPKAAGLRQRGSQVDSQAQSSLQHSTRGAYKTKATTYHREASHHHVVLVPFIMTDVSGFTPRDTACDAGGLLDPIDALSCLDLFHRGTPPGTRLLSPLR